MISAILSLAIVFAVVGCSNSKVSFNGSKTSDEEGKGATYYYGRHNPLWYKAVGGANKQLECYCNAVRVVSRM